MATKTSLAGYEIPGTFEAVRAEALFASTMQPSGSPCPDQIRRAVATTLQRLGVRGCAGRVASEFGDHPCGHRSSSGHDPNAKFPRLNGHRT